jgi:hypothetical protein
LHPEGGDLTKRRAEALRGYLIESGVAEDQLAIVIDSPDSKGPPFDVRLAIPRPRH